MTESWVQITQKFSTFAFGGLRAGWAKKATKLFCRMRQKSNCKEENNPIIKKMQNSWQSRQNTTYWLKGNHYITLEGTRRLLEILIHDLLTCWIFLCPVTPDLLANWVPFKIALHKIENLILKNSGLTVPDGTWNIWNLKSN